MKPNEMSVQALAYLGDAVFELTAREKAISSGVYEIGKLNEIVKNYVKATAQSEAVGRLEPHLNEEEISVYKRGRNYHGTSLPKSATAGEYRRATGLEVLFAFLYLNNKHERLNQLFDIAFNG